MQSVKSAGCSTCGGHCAEGACDTAGARTRFSGPVPYAFSKPAGQPMKPAGQFTDGFYGPGIMQGAIGPRSVSQDIQQYDIYGRPIHPVHMERLFPGFSNPNARALAGRAYFSPAGQVYTDPFGVGSGLSTVDTGGKTVTGPNGETVPAPTTTAVGLNFAGQALNMGAQTILGIINSNNAARIAELHDQTALRIAELRGSAAPDSNQLQALQALNAQLQAQLQGQNTTPTPWPMYIAIGAGVLLLGGVALFLALRKSPRSNPVVTRNGHKKFIPAAELRSGKRRRNKRRAKKH